MTNDEKAALADVYERAAEYLEVKGWCQGTLGEPGKARCLIGALESATNFDYKVVAKAGTFAEDVLELPDRNCYSREWMLHPIAEWNDDPDRTKDEVINLMHGLANKLR